MMQGMTSDDTIIPCLVNVGSQCSIHSRHQLGRNIFWQFGLPAYLLPRIQQESLQRCMHGTLSELRFR